MLLSHLEYLVAVKKYGSMNKAATALFCAQPTISSAFQSLEKELGCKILDRSASGSTFTSEGAQIVADAEIILGMIQNWKHLSSASSVDIHLAFSMAFGTPPMLDLLFEYQRSHSNVKFKLMPSLGRGIDMLATENGELCRFGLFPRTPQELPETKKAAASRGMRIAMISKGSFLLCVSAKHQLACKPHIYLHDLTGQKAVLKGGTEGFPYYDKLQEIHCGCSMAMGDHANIMISLLNSTDMISFRPEFTLENDTYINSGHIVARSVEDCTMAINRYFIYPEYSRMNREERMFIDYLRGNAAMFEPV